MLSRDEAIAILEEHGENAPWTRHCYAVADAAMAVATRLPSSLPIDLDSLWSTALLHDIGRCVTHHPVMHGVEGYRLLADRGHHDVAFVCASHILFGLSREESAACGLPAQDFVPVTYAQRIVPLVDYLIEGDRPTTLSHRFASLRKRNAHEPWFLERLGRAHRIAADFMEQLSETIGQPVEHVVASLEPRP